MACVPVHLQGADEIATVYCAIDTGARYTLLPPRTLARVGTTLGPAMRIATASDIAQVPTAEVDVRAIGHQRTLTVVVAELPPSIPFRGLLGLDFFEGRRLTLDFAGGTVELD